MKILSIAFKNINSLKGENFIDFEAAPFSGNTLFAITGPTGSGKSSILDVISLALFNQVPRLGKISKKEIREKGAILTRNQKEAYAKVTYQTNAGRFTSSWSIEVNRNGNLNDYNMEIANLQDNSILDLKKSEVPAKNEDLIGLNYDQFIKSVLLAQGDFAKFLSAKKEERGELLEKITGTGIYRQLGILAFERFKAETSEIEKQQNEIKLISSYLLSKEDLEIFNKDLKEKTAKTESLQKNLKLIDKQLELKQSIKNQEKEISSLNEKEIKLHEQLKEFENEYGESLKQHEKLQPIAEELHTWKRFKQELEDLKSGLGKTSEKIESNKENTINFIQQVKSFVHEEVSAENLKEKLSDFTEKIRKLQEEKTSLGRDYKSKLQLFKTETRELNLEFPENDLKLGKEIFRNLKAEKTQQKKQLEVDLKEIDKQNLASEKNRLKTELEKSHVARSFSEKNLQQKQNQLDLKKEIQSLQPELESLPKIVQEEETLLISLKKDLEILQLKKDNQLKTAQLEDLRNSLKTGEACPLCGSHDHPYSEHLPDFEDDLAVKISAKNSEIDQHNTKLTQVKSKLLHLEESLKKYQKQLGEIEAEITKNEKDFKQKYPGFEKPEAINWETHISRLNTNIENLEFFETINQQLKAIESGYPILEELEKILQRGKLLQQQLQEQYSGKNIGEDSQQLMDRWNSLNQEKKYLQEQEKEQKEQLQQKSKIYNELREKLEQQVLNKNFECLENAYHSLLPGNKFFDLKKQKDDFLKQKSIVETEISTLRKQLKEIKENESKRSIDDLTTEQKQKQEDFLSTQSNCEELRRKLGNNTEYISRLKNLENQIAEKEKECKRWRLLNTLIGDRQGKKFNDFAQDLTLSQLIYLANIRLKDLSERYKIDKAIDGEDDGLVAIDEDMGGQRRSVKTLSGGETFLLSLSLALALSDLASRNVEINSLFIDEGFGTLDPETLDQTLDTLEKLQAESGKTIGIISHVASLKERIGTQIQLTRNGQGYSSLVVK
ncbi:SbcC/MukB-like Walker B domain-containing protein [Salegentibacter salegens]|uniref:Exonuclease SbcC n=1 Tax=Salegentibacter salegens TaxID=143223 RepID=A0A1M7LKX3_9FLAO|nr:SbcC/MukB-like Walker B domain-containing protein [Salegentibacter salegens]PRX50709.1 exonuclease SbcC [Salegentibacter salegens]SHM78647.1 exonuclease SbcC [Salegentibacter salegens]